MSFVCIYRVESSKNKDETNASKHLTGSVHIYVSHVSIYQIARCTRLQPLGVACHVPGNVVNPELWRQELVEVDDGRIELFTQDLFVFPFFPFLESNSREICKAAHVIYVTWTIWPTTPAGAENVTTGSFKALTRVQCCAPIVVLNRRHWRCIPLM